MSTINQEQIMIALSNIIHPSLGKDIVSAGMIHDLRIEGNAINFTIQYPKQNDPLKSSIEKACMKVIHESVSKELEIKIHSVFQSSPKTGKPHAISKSETLPHVKNIIAIASGKGGVGKSTVAVNLAVALGMQGYKTGLLDADIFGPSIPKMLNAEGIMPEVKHVDGKDIIIPLEKYGIKILSIGFFVSPDSAAIWRGPMASNALKQLLVDSDWGELDYLVIDLPPGTSDIHLTVLQTVSLSGAVIVSTPQDVALADVKKGISMFRNPDLLVPIIGIVENMAWFTPEELPNNKYYIFGKDGCKKIAEQYQLPVLCQIPLVQGIREAADSGLPIVMQNAIHSHYFIDLAQTVVKNT